MVEQGRGRHKPESAAIGRLEKNLQKLPKYQTFGPIAAAVSALRGMGIELQVEAPEQFLTAAIEALKGRSDRDEVVSKLSEIVSGHIEGLKSNCKSHTPFHSAIAAILNSKRLLYNVSGRNSNRSRLEEIGVLEDAFYCLSLANCESGAEFKPNIGRVAGQIIRALVARKVIEKVGSLIDNFPMPAIPRTVFTEMLQAVCEDSAGSQDRVNQFLGRYRAKIDSTSAIGAVRPQVEYFVRNIDSFGGPVPSPDMVCPQNWPKVLWRIYCLVSADRAIQNGDKEFGRKLAMLAMPRVRRHTGSTWGVSEGPTYNRGDFDDCAAIFTSICSQDPKSLTSGIALLSNQEPFNRIFPASIAKSGDLRFKIPPAKILRDIFGLGDIPIVGGWPSSNRVVEYLLKDERQEDLAVPSSMKTTIDNILAKFKQRNPSAIPSFVEELSQIKGSPRLYFYLAYLGLAIHSSEYGNAVKAVVPKLFPEPAERILLLAALEAGEEPFKTGRYQGMIIKAFGEISSDAYDRVLDVVGLLSESLANSLVESTPRYIGTQSRLPSSAELRDSNYAPLEVGPIETSSRVHLFGALVVADALTVAEVEELKSGFSESDFLPAGQDAVKGGFQELQAQVNVVVPGVTLSILDPVHFYPAQQVPKALSKIGTLWLPPSRRLVMSRALAYQLSVIGSSDPGLLTKWLVNLVNSNHEGILSAQLAIQAELFGRADIGKFEPYFGGALLPRAEPAKLGVVLGGPGGFNVSATKGQLLMLGGPSFFVREESSALSILFSGASELTTGHAVSSLATVASRFADWNHGYGESFSERISIDSELDCPVAVYRYYSKDTGLAGLHIHSSLLSLEPHDLQSILVFFDLESYSRYLVRTGPDLRPELSARLQLSAALMMRNESQPESPVGYGRLTSAFQALGVLGWNVSGYLNMFSALQSCEGSKTKRGILNGDIAVRCCADLHATQEESGRLWAIVQQRIGHLSALSSDRDLPVRLNGWNSGTAKKNGDESASSRAIFGSFFAGSDVREDKALLKAFQATCHWTAPMAVVRALATISDVGDRVRLLSSVALISNFDVQPFRGKSPIPDKEIKDPKLFVERRIETAEGLAALSMQKYEGRHAYKSILMPSTTAYDLWSLGYSADQNVMETGRWLASTLAKLTEDPLIGSAASVLLNSFVERHGQIYGLLRADLSPKVLETVKPALRVALAYVSAREKSGMLGDPNMLRLSRTVQDDLDSLIKFGHFPIPELESFGLMTLWDGNSIFKYIVDRVVAATPEDKVRYVEELARKLSDGAGITPAVVNVAVILLPHAAPSLQAQLVHAVSVHGIPNPIGDWLRKQNDSSISEFADALIKSQDRYLAIHGNLPEDLKERLVRLTPPASLDALLKCQDTDAVRSIIKYRTVTDGEIDSQATKAANAALREKYEQHVCGLPTDLPNLLAGSGKLPNYYAILGVPKNSSRDVIAASFKKLSMIYHPDRFNNESADEKERGKARFQTIKAAWDVLQDWNQGGKKQLYDRSVTRNPSSYPAESWLEKS